MGNILDDFSLMLTKSYLSGFFPKVSASEKDFLTQEAKNMFGDDSILVAQSAVLENGLTKGISVKSKGALGDGVTDDTTAIHAARDSAATLGVDVFFPPGIYRANIAANKPNQTWWISKTATIKPLDNTASSIFICTASNVTVKGGGTLDGSTTTNPGSAGVYTFSSSVTDLTLDDISIINTAGYGVQSCSSRTIIKNCKITNSGATSINIGPATADVVDCEVSGTTVDRLTAVNTAYACIFVAGTAGGLKVRRTKLHKNTCIMSSGNFPSAEPIGLEIQRGTVGTSILGNHTFGGAMGISVAGGSHGTVVDDNVIFGPSWYGIEIADSAYCSVSDNTIDGNAVLGSGATGSTYAIVFNAGTINCDKNTVTGNTIKNLAVGPTSSSCGIAFAGNGGVGNVVANNTLEVAMHGITVVGTYSEGVIADNSIYGNSASGSRAIWLNNTAGSFSIGVNLMKNFIYGISNCPTNKVTDFIAVSGNMFIAVTTPKHDSPSGSGTIGTNVLWSGNVGIGVVNG